MVSDDGAVPAHVTYEHSVIKNLILTVEGLRRLFAAVNERRSTQDPSAVITVIDERTINYDLHASDASPRKSVKFAESFRQHTQDTRCQLFSEMPPQIETAQVRLIDSTYKAVVLATTLARGKCPSAAMP
jgi:hypothetical protein